MSIDHLIEDGDLRSQNLSSIVLGLAIHEEIKAFSVNIYLPDKMKMIVV